MAAMTAREVPCLGVIFLTTLVLQGDAGCATIAQALTDIVGDSRLQIT